MFDLIASILSWFYDLTGSKAGAIALLTLGVLVVSTPLTLQGTRSMLKMQVLQPELKAIQNKYPKDKREEMNAELMAFYKDNNINPVGGCLPMLFQIPVFLVLYRVILGLTRRATDVGSQLGQVVGQIAAPATTTKFEATDAALFNPAYLDHTSDLWLELSQTNEMTSFGFDISRAASQVLGDGPVTAFPYLLLVLIVGVTGWFQHKMIRSRNTGAAANPTQDMIMKIMPYFLPVFSFTLPAAIVVYFFVSNLYRIGQQYYITRSMYHGEDSLGAQVRKNRENSAAQDGKSGGNKGGNAKNNGNKGGNAKNNGNKGGNAKNNGNKSGGQKKPAKKNSAGSNAKTKPSTAPGRNSSGRQGSARAQVQPKARKKKKR
jgi:YidC/Oxa1 family membrane protein insertase